MSPTPTADEPFLRRKLPESVLFAVRAAAIAFSLVLLLMYLRWVPVWLEVRAAEAATAAAQGGGFQYLGAARVATGAALFSAIAWIALAHSQSHGTIRNDRHQLRA